MGVIKFFRSASSYDTARDRTVESNPDPLNFKIIKHLEINNNLIVWINYPDSVNYEGNKILVFNDYSIAKLRKRKSVDPHFSKSKKFKSPFARFEPTKKGWDMAIKLCKK